VKTEEGLHSFRVTAFENIIFIQPIPPLRGDVGGCNKTLIFFTNIFIEKPTNTPQAPLKGGIEKVDIPNAVTLTFVSSTLQFPKNQYRFFEM
jgi:hypothetical protein